MKKIMIETKSLCKSFIIGKTSNNVLKNINLSIYEGEFTIIMGSSGSGKSTLLYSLSTMDRPTSGQVIIQGVDVTALEQSKIAAIRKKKLSFIFQNSNLLTDINVFENIAYCGYGVFDKATVNKKTWELLDRFDLRDSALKYPSELSGGMQQRVAIARAMVCKADIIFGDEPTGSLNSSMGSQVLDFMTAINEEGQTIVMVTHDLKAAARATRLLYLSDGRIVGDLSLGRYTQECEKDREHTIYSFLKEQNW